MKKINIQSFIAVILISALIMSGCSGVKKMQKEYSKVGFKANPEVLKTKGGKIYLNVSGSIPEKYFGKKTKMNIEPVLKYEGGTTPLKPILLKGEKAEGDGTVIKNKEGGSFAADYVIDYIPAMLESKLVVNPKIEFKGKTTDLPETKIGDGVIITETRIDNTDSDMQLATSEYEKATMVDKKANMYFPYSKYNWDKNLKLNKVKENMDKLTDLQEFIKKQWEVKSSDINAWASPEGEDKYNENLSKDRANTGDKYMKEFYKTFQNELIKNLKKANKKVNKEDIKKIQDKFSSLKFNISAKGEDKEGFVEAVKASDLKDKNAIINVIETEKVKSAREKKIKDMTVIYGDVESLLEPLRRAEISYSFLEPKKTDQQIAVLSTTHPDSLDIKELLYAATLTNDDNTKLKIYKSAVTLHPDNWKTYNNAGYVDFKLGNYDEAGTYFDKANTLSPNNGIVLNNLGAVALAKNNFEAAKSFYESAKSNGVNTDYNLGIVLITQGNYEDAMKNFESKKCDYNVALAQLLLDNITGAQSNLDCADKNGEIYYLMAVIGARTQNAQMMTDNLKKAIQIDPKFRKQAKVDREFIKYFNNADFMEITKF